MKRAIIIGINYTLNESMKLYGCINDANHIRNMLIDAYDIDPAKITMLLDNSNDAHLMPSRENILRELKRLVAECARSDELWFYYSGHGSLRNDANQDEIDGSDSAIIPIDYDESGIITDDLLLTTIKDISCPLFLFFDSCHSGTVCDLQWSYEYRISEDDIIMRKNNEVVLSNPFIFMISGSRDSELSYDVKQYDVHNYYGAFTHALTECLRMRRHTVNWITLYKDVVVYLSQEEMDQTPVLSVSSRNYLHRQIYRRSCKIQ